MRLLSSRTIAGICYILDNVSQPCDENPDSMHQYYNNYMLTPFLVINVVIVNLIFISGLHYYGKNNLLDPCSASYKFGYLYKEYR